MFKNWFQKKARDDQQGHVFATTSQRPDPVDRSDIFAEIDDLFGKAATLPAGDPRRMLVGRRILDALEDITANEHQLGANESVAALEIAARGAEEWPDLGGFNILQGGLLVTNGRFEEGLAALAAGTSRLPARSDAFVGLAAITKFSERLDQQKIPADETADEDATYTGAHAEIVYGLLKGNLGNQHPLAADRFHALAQFHSFRLCERGEGLLPVLQTASAQDRVARLWALIEWSRAGAQDEIAALLKDEPAHPEALLARAYVYLKDKDIGAALRAIDELLAAHPDHVEAMLLFARALDDDGFRDEAVNVLSNLLERQDVANGKPAVLATLHQARGQLLQQRGDQKGAIRDFDRVIALSDKPADALRLRGVAHRELGNYEVALQDLTASLAEAPLDARTLVSRAMVYECVRNLEHATADYTAALCTKEDDGNRHAHERARDRLTALSTITLND